MAVNLSKFDGIPTKLSTAKNQFNKLYKEESKRAFNKGRWTVLKKETSGPYKGYYGTYIYSTKPSGRFLLKRQIKK